MEHVEVHIFDSQLQVISNLPVFDSSASHAFWLCLYKMNDKYFLTIFYLEDKIEQIISEIHITSAWNFVFFYLHYSCSNFSGPKS